MPFSMVRSYSDDQVLTLACGSLRQYLYEYERASYNFNSFLDAFLTLFGLFVGDGVTNVFHALLDAGYLAGAVGPWRSYIAGYAVRMLGPPEPLPLVISPPS
jgi:hypothetical protein